MDLVVNTKALAVEEGWIIASP